MIKIKNLNGALFIDIPNYEMVMNNNEADIVCYLLCSSLNITLPNELNNNITIPESNEFIDAIEVTSKIRTEIYNFNKNYKELVKKSNSFYEDYKTIKEFLLKDNVTLDDIANSKYKTELLNMYLSVNKDKYFKQYLGL